MAQSNPYPLRVDKAIMDKFRVIAAENGRSINKEIEYMIRISIQEYEKSNGPIDPSQY